MKKLYFSFCMLISLYGQFDSEKFRDIAINNRLNVEIPVQENEQTTADFVAYVLPGRRSDPDTRQQESLVDTDNIIINGKGAHKLTPGSSIGIEVNPNHSGVIVENFSYIDFSEQGIKVNEGCKNLILRNINLINCAHEGGFAVDLLGTPANPIENCIFENIIIADTSFDMDVITIGGGFRLSNVKNCTFRNCKVVNWDSNEVEFNGFQILDNSNDNQFTQCSVVNCMHSSDAGENVIGFLINNSNNNQFIECRASELNNASNAQTQGFSLESSECIALSKCQLCDLSSMGDCFGYLFMDCTNCLINNSYATGTKTNPVLMTFSENAIGFSINSSNNITLEKCFTSNSQVLNGLGDALGFSFINTTSSIIKTSKSTNHSSISGTNAGFKFDSCFDCLANKNLATHSDIGFEDTSGANNVFTFNIASTNTTNYSGISNQPLSTVGGSITAGTNIDA